MLSPVGNDMDVFGLILLILCCLIFSPSLDECARTCALFLEVGGLQAAFRALIHYNDNSSVQTKVLGLLVSFVL